MDRGAWQTIVHGVAESEMSETNAFTFNFYFYYYYISSTSDHQALDPRGWEPLVYKALPR